MLNAIEDVAALGVSRICLIGSDTPELGCDLLALRPVDHQRGGRVP
ncbi:MAG: hypothetical protein H0U74_22815 [Bradymonadaceae bacterium]|nr:hypothetical protein [Lujinxingiaceae bacterium]